MEQLILIAHLLIALAIIGLVMIQQGKGADMGASFGSGASATLFGSDGSGNVLSRATTYLVICFFATSFSLAVIAKGKSETSGELEFAAPTVEVQEQGQDLGLDIPALDEQTAAAATSLEDDIPAVED